MLPSKANPEHRKLAQAIFQNGYDLLLQGNLEKADELLHEAHQLDPVNVEVLNLMGARFYEKKDFANALDFLSKANRLRPNSAHTLNNLGLVHSDLQAFEEAIPFFKHALENSPYVPEIHNNYGNALRGIKKDDEAIDAYVNAIKLRPSYAEAHSNCGVILLERGQIQQAINHFKNAIESNLNFDIAFNNLGNAYTQIKEYESAFQCFERALQINPKYLDACLNFGNSLKKAKQIKAAIDCYQYALKINPNNAITYYLLGEIHYDIGDAELAKTYYANSLELDPNNTQTQFALVISQIPKVYKDLKELNDSRIAFSNELLNLRDKQPNTQNDSSYEKNISRHPFYLTYQDKNNEPLLSQFGSICTKYAKSIQDKLAYDAKIPKDTPKIQIGIVSNFICNHPVWHAITKGWVKHINPDQFDVHIFNTNGSEDEETRQAKVKSASYTNCGSAVIETAQRILNQNLDVILYPEIGMDQTSKALACLRLAPTQIVSWGHPETTGLPTLDFFLSAQYLEAKDSEKFYNERLIKLPGLGTYFEYEEIQAANPDLEILGIQSKKPILLCAGSPSKYSPENDELFIRIAKKLEVCQFIFFNFDDNLTAILKNRLQNVFARNGLDATQFLLFIPFLNKQEFSGLMQKADIYLDTIGFSGFNTAIQAIQCNLPIVTMEGTKMRGRLASALLNAMGLQKFVCTTESEYVDFAVELIQNQELRTSYIAEIRKSKMKLFNDLSPIRALEDFLMQQVKKNP